MTIGVLAAFLLYLRQFFAPMEELSQFYNLFQAAAAATEKLSGVLAEAPSVPEPVEPTPLPHAHGEIRFEGVEFGYRERTVLHHLDLTIPAGQTLAVVGATGAGKTTIARLAARFWDPTDGAVLLDGIDLRDLTEADLRRAVITVTQESFLFAGSVADNIELGRPGATREEIEDAARAIGAHGFITRLPEGYDTDVHQKGARLSSGPAPAGVVRPRLPRRSGGAHPRRGHLVARRALRAPGAARAAHAARGPDRGDHRPPPHHGGDRRPRDRRRRRAHRRGRPARRR